MLGRLSHSVLNALSRLRMERSGAILGKRTSRALDAALLGERCSTGYLVKDNAYMSLRAMLSTGTNPISSTGVKGSRTGKRWPKGQPAEESSLPVSPMGVVKLPPNLKLAEEAMWDENGKADLTDPEGTDPVSESVRDLSEGTLETNATLTLPPYTGVNTTSMEVPVIAWTEEGMSRTRVLNKDVFGVPIRRDVVHDVIRWQLAKRRAGNAVTKRVAEISGSGKKVRPQKGMGRARAGHSRPPHWRGGYKPHGPRKRDWSFKLNKKVRRMGLRVALSARLLEGKLTVVDKLTRDSYSTSATLQALKEKGVVDNKGEETVTFIVGDTPEPEFYRSTSNVVGFRVIPVRCANVYEVIQRTSLVLTEEAVDSLEGLLKQS
ncbi:unnamed protein product [Choristocarpus tenellus]